MEHAISIFLYALTFVILFPFIVVAWIAIFGFFQWALFPITSRWNDYKNDRAILRARARFQKERNSTK